MRDEDHVNESWLFSMGANAGDSPKTAQEVAMEFTKEEREEIWMRKGMSKLYAKVRFLHMQLNRKICVI